MKTDKQSGPEIAPWFHSKENLSEGDLRGNFVIIGPGGEVPLEESETERVAYVANGQVTAVVAGSHFMLKPDETLRIPGRRVFWLQNRGDFPAKVFLLTLPRPKVVKEFLP